MPRPTLSAILAGILLTASPAAAADPPVTGKFTGNGKEAKLPVRLNQKGGAVPGQADDRAHLHGEGPLEGQATGVRGRVRGLRQRLILTVKEDGKIIGCVVAHRAHEKKGFNSLGSIDMSDFKKADGTLTGRVKTNGVVNTFGEKWEVDLKFEAKAP